MFAFKIPVGSSISVDLTKLFVGSSCTTVVEHTPVKQNSRGCGFESFWVLGFSLLYSISSAS